MAKKSLKRGLALGALMAFVITGSAMAAEVSYSEDTTLIASSADTIESTNRTAGLRFDHAGTETERVQNIINIADGKLLTVVNDKSLTSSGSRVYGIALEKYNNATINGDIKVLVTGSNGVQVRGIRNGWGNSNLEINGNTIVSVVSEEGSSYVTGLDTWDGGKSIFNGDVDIEASGVNSITNNDRWVNAAQVAGGEVAFNGSTTTLTAKNDNYTAQTMMVQGDPNNLSDYPNGVIIFNCDKTSLNAISNYGTNVIGYGDSAKFNQVIFQKGDVTLHAIISDGVGASNAIGILGGDHTEVTDGVDSFNIIVEGAGVDNGDPGNSNGTAGIYENWGETIINSKNLNISVISGENTENSTFDKSAADALGYNYCTAYGIRADRNGSVSVGKDTSTIINVRDNYKNAIGIYAGALSTTSSAPGFVNILGDTSINAKGGIGTYAIKANSASSVNIGSEGKTISIIGDIQSDNAIINLTGAKVDLTGAVATLNSGTTNINFGSGTWNISEASTITSATFGAGSSLVIDGTKFTGEDANYAITGKVSVDPTANLVIKNSTPNTLYKVVDGENNISDSNLSYDRTELVAVENTKGVYEVNFKTVDKASAAELTSAQNKAITAAGGSQLIAPNMVAAGIGPNAAAGSKALVGAITSSGASGSEMAQMFNDNANIGEEAGTSATATSIMNNVIGITTQRMSFTQMNTAPQGGHGKVERKYKIGAGVWAQYMHGKDKVEDMPSAGGANSYDSQYNGAVIGYDFKEVGKTHTGISFNYGEGDSHSKKSITSTRNDFDFWGVGLYHSIMNDDTNLIFDINYNKSDADVKQIVAGHEVTASPKTSSFSVGVRAEKLIQNGPVQIVPYAGARFLTIDTDDYKSSADYWYAPERQNIWLIPVGVSLRQENVYENGWKVTPKADLSYVWALGDTDSSTTVSSGAGSNPFEYTVMDNGSFLGTLGIEAEKGDWTYGLSYSYQKGEYQRSDKWFVDVRYSF